MGFVAGARRDRKRKSMTVRPVPLYAEVELVQRNPPKRFALLTDEEHQRVRACEEDMGASRTGRTSFGEDARKLRGEPACVVWPLDALWRWAIDWTH